MKDLAKGGAMGRTGNLFYDPEIKRYNTDVATVEQLLRIIQSIPSPKAEPFKMWLAAVGSERIDETVDPELNYSCKCKYILKKFIFCVTLNYRQ